MSLYRIAGLYVEMTPLEKTLCAQSADYSVGESVKPDIVIDVKREDILSLAKEQPQLSVDDCEYILTGSAFYKQLLGHGGFLLHASAVELDGRAYLFSAPSGTGKSTHTSLWLRRFGDRARIINDDKPALISRKHGFDVCGTPWSGKTSLNLNLASPLAGIAMLSRSETNSVSVIPPAEALKLILEQTVRPKAFASELLVLLDKLLTEVKVYSLKCNMDIEAADTAYAAMRGETCL